MFESKLNIYTIQKSAERKVFCLFYEKVWKIGQINLKLSGALINDRTQHILHPCESLYQTIFIDIKYIDIAQYLTTQWAEMCNALDFSKSDQIRT